MPGMQEKGLLTIGSVARKGPEMKTVQFANSTESDEVSHNDSYSMCMWLILYAPIT